MMGRATSLVLRSPTSVCEEPAFHPAMTGGAVPKRSPSIGWNSPAGDGGVGSPVFTLLDLDRYKSAKLFQFK
jgi:hypothetical protein